MKAVIKYYTTLGEIRPYFIQKEVCNFSFSQNQIQGTFLDFYPQNGVKTPP